MEVRAGNRGLVNESALIPMLLDYSQAVELVADSSVFFALPSYGIS
jgi:hypothetical protein